MSDIKQVLLIVGFAAALILSLGWVARDARKRGRGFSIVLLCLITFPIGPVLWLVIRPALTRDGLS